MGNVWENRCGKSGNIPLAKKEISPDNFGRLFLEKF